MNMKNTFKISFAAILLCALAALPLRAQTNTSTETGMTNAAGANIPAHATVDNSQGAQSPSVHIDMPGIHIGGANSENEEGFTRALALFIPIVAIVMGCSIPIVIVGLQIYFRHRKNQMLHETVRAMVEKGVPIPPEMFQKTEHEFMEHDKPKQPRNDLRVGLIFIGVGIGMVIIAGKTGFIILFMGVAFVAASFLDKKNKNDAQPPKP
jgi:Domain of unknown function (DUF6249)